MRVPESQNSTDLGKEISLEVVIRKLYFSNEKQYPFFQGIYIFRYILKWHHITQAGCLFFFFPVLALLLLMICPFLCSFFSLLPSPLLPPRQLQSPRSICTCVKTAICFFLTFFTKALWSLINTYTYIYVCVSVCSAYMA